MLLTFFMVKEFKIRRQYHVEGWNKGATFALVKIDGDFAIIETPTTHKVFRVEKHRLYNTKKNQGK